MAEEQESCWQKNIDSFRSQAIFSDETREYRIPMEPTASQEVTIRLRTGKDTILTAFLCTAEENISMKKMKSQGCFDFYEIVLPPSANTVQYYFLLEWDEGRLYYTKYGVFSEFKQEGWFRILRDYQTPDWAKGAVMYQIFPDRFYNGDLSNDVLSGEYRYLGALSERVSDWEKLPAEDDIRNFYGGDLQGILDKLDYLQNLGVEVLYLNPIFVSPSNHKYDVQDYEHIDPHLGRIVSDYGNLIKGIAENNEATRYIERVTSEKNLTAGDLLFAELMQEVHKRGMRLILDGVFNHCGAFHKWLDREGVYEKQGNGAFRHKDSPYYDYFCWNEDESYEGWWGHQNHPKLNFEENKDLVEEIYRIGQKWVSPPFCADGWRLDVAADLGRTEQFNHAFWRGFRQAVKTAAPEAFILAEHYGDASHWLLGDQWDSIMNYDAFMEPVSWFFTGISKHSTERREDLYNNADIFWGSMSYQMTKLPAQAIITAMNELSNHDHSRFLTRTNGKIGRLQLDGAEEASLGIETAVMREAVLLQMTWLGAPTVYYGDEAGLVGWTDPDNRRTYPWGKEDQDMLAFHKAVIALRKEAEALRYGSLKQLYGAYGIIAYGRFTEKERYIIAFNNTKEPKQISIPTWQIGLAEEGKMQVQIKTDAWGFSTEGVMVPVADGHMVLSLYAQSGVLLKEV